MKVRMINFEEGVKDPLTNEAKEARREYYQNYQEENREALNNYLKGWRAKNKDKVKQYNQRYWENKVLQGV